MNPIDRAAAALASSLDGTAAWSEVHPARQNRLKGCVLEVLRALREPDERMTEAGAEIVRNVARGESDVAYASDATNTWRYMIDTLLSET